jgi:peptidoglycan/xylan/chitin deacetylase (PgdA/CDA1 family)
MILTAFSVLAVTFVFIYVVIPWLFGRGSRILLRIKAAKSNSLVLTFDDGPSSRLTLAILSVLDEHNVKATFFLLGRNITGREEIVRQITEQGHEICSHGYDHLNHWKVSPFRALSDIKRGWQAIDLALGSNRGIYPFRPPNGKLNLISFLYLWFRRVPIVYWSVDLGDTWFETIDPARIAHLAKEAGGAVSLAHDFDRSDDTLDSLILESVRSALTMAQQTGMQVLTCSELFSRGKGGN